VLALAARQASDLGRLDEAVELANRALTGDPHNIDARLVRARIHFRSRRMKLAIADLEAAVGVKPDDVGALQLLAQAQKTMGQTREAAASQKRADQLRDRRILMDQLSKAIEARPDDPEPRWRMGQAAMEAEMYVLADQSFQAALDLDPSYQPARTALERLRTQKGFEGAPGAGSQLRIRSQAAGSRP
jgi:tetratricopeptide (TPR) repeat protein